MPRFSIDSKFGFSFNETIEDVLIGFVDDFQPFDLKVVFEIEVFAKLRAFDDKIFVYIFKIFIYKLFFKKQIKNIFFILKIK